jgi:hypothetical protein
MTRDYDRHIYLYAKNWYKRTDLIEDLKKLLSVRSGIPQEYISTENIVHVLSNITSNYIGTPDKAERFIDDLHHRYTFNKYFINEESSFEETLITTMLSILAFLEVKDIPFELGEPDYNILPKKDDIKS